VQSNTVEDGYKLNAGDTTIRLVQGEGLSLLLEPLSDSLPIRKLSAIIPGIRWLKKTAAGSSE
jgi:hypothetical protein